MKGYSYDLGKDDCTFLADQTRDFRLATSMVECIRDREPLVRCHELTRAVCRFLEHPWTLRDGKFGSVQHTWLVGQPRSGYAPAILDVYSVARLPMVQLVYNLNRVELPYQALESRNDIHNDVVRSLVQELKLEHRFVLRDDA